MPMQLKRIETHSHLMPNIVYGTAGSYGPEMIIDETTGDRIFRAGKYRTPSGTFRVTPMPPGQKRVLLPIPDPAERLAEMDRLDIDVMGVAASPLIYCYGAPAPDGINYARVYNDAMAEYCAASPGRLFFIPTLPMQDIPAAIRESERASKNGGRAVNVATDNIAGRDLDDEGLFAFYEYCDAEEIAIWLHPAPIGTDDSGYDEARNELDKYAFGWLLGYPYREVVAFGNLILSGVLDRFPRLRICLPHGGGFVPYQVGRLDYAWQKKLSTAICNRRPVYDYLKNFYFDNVIHDRRARRFLIEIMGVDNVFVGSNYGGWDWVNGFDYAADMVDTAEDLHKLCAGNAAALFKLDGMGREVP